jgi:hypothetical protein
VEEREGGDEREGEGGERGSERETVEEEEREIVEEHDQRQKGRTELNETAVEMDRDRHSFRDAADYDPSPLRGTRGRLLDSDERTGDDNGSEVEVVAVVPEVAQRDGLKLAAACGATRAVIVDENGDVTGAVAALAELLTGSEPVTFLAVPDASEKEVQHGDGGASPAARALQRQLQDVTLEEGSALSPPAADGCSQSDISHYYATSGTTGAPKVVACTRGALRLYAESHAQVHNYTSASRILLASAPLFDPFVGEVSPSQFLRPKC